MFLTQGLETIEGHTMLEIDQIPEWFESADEIFETHQSSSYISFRNRKIYSTTFHRHCDALFSNGSGSLMNDIWLIPTYSWASDTEL